MPWADIDVKAKLAQTQVELKIVEYMCKRVVDNGISIPFLFHNEPMTFTVVNSLPVNFKISLLGFNPPLVLKFKPLLNA